MVDLNYQNASNVTNIQQLFEYANRVSDGVFGLGILISTYIIFTTLSFLSSRRMDFAAITGIFFTVISAIILYAMGTIPFMLLIIPILILFATVYLIYSNRD